MYGYVVPYKPQLKMQDFVLYRSFYCGICKATGRLYGQTPRFTTNYDVTFLSVLMHDCNTQEVRFSEERCVCNPFKKKPVIGRNPLLDSLAAANLIMAYYKAVDGVIDKDGLSKRAAKIALKRSYKKAAKACPEADEIVRTSYEALRAVERDNTAGVDRAAHPFAEMLRRLAVWLLDDKADVNKSGLCYNIGKFVYLADALDDIGDDAKKKRYNPFIATYGFGGDRAAFIAEHRAELEFVFGSTVNRAIECFNNCRFTQSYDLMQNIVYLGLREKVKELLNSTEKLRYPKI